MLQDYEYMRRALELARLAEGDTSPNPMVGCVIVADDGSVVGEGYHHKAGQPHAEVNALAMAGEKARGAAAYVTLEPCSHYGRTGPCCEALIKAGIKKVVLACLDPNPLVAGKGAERLRQAGVEVVCGVGEAEAKLLNERFFVWITRRRPFVSLKYAMTLDGKIASCTGDSKWITGVKARSYAHYLRKVHDAVMVGCGTVLADDPELTTRLVKGKNPVRVVVDGRLRAPVTAKVFNGDAPALVFTTKLADAEKAARLSRLPHVEVVTLPEADGAISVDAMLEELARREITSVLVEGGSALHGAFFDAGAADRIYAFVAPKVIGGANALTPVGGRGASLVRGGWQLEQMSCTELDGDYLLTARVREKK